MVRRLRFASLLVPVLLLAVLVGCGRHKEDDEDVLVPRSGGKSGGADAKLRPVRKLVDGKEVEPPTTTVTGRVVLKVGADVKLDELKQAFVNGLTKDREVCLQATDPDQLTDNRWLVGSDRGVKYTFVWLRPAEETQFFDVSKLVQEKAFATDVVLDQPYCVFVPHALVLFPRYIDPAKPSEKWQLPPPLGPPETGQQFVIKNTSALLHNANYLGKSTSGGNESLQARTGATTIANSKINPSYASPVTVSCSIHTWMKAYIWAFPHPFAAVTDKDGNFTIKNVPAEVPVRIVGWHESVPKNWLLGDGGKKTEDGAVVTFKKGTDKFPDIVIEP